MKHWGPLLTAAVVVLGLVGFLVTNTVGGLVVAQEQAAPPPATSTPATPQPPTPEPSVPSEEPSPSSEQPDPGVPEQVFTGTAAESRGLAIAVAVKGTEAAAYLCDGSEIEAWLKGEVNRGEVSLSAADGSASLTATLSDGGLAGEGETQGRPFTFELDLADKPAGLYRGENGTSVVGWIVLEDGTQVGVANTPTGKKPAPTLDPDSDDNQVDAKRVAVVVVQGDTEF